MKNTQQCIKRLIGDKTAYNIAVRVGRREKTYLNMIPVFLQQIS